MDLGLTDKVAIVTGSSRGIGRGIALSLAAEGCRIIACARTENDVQAVSSEIFSIGGECLPVTMDITTPGNEKILIEAALKKYKRLDILVNNVGGNRRGNFEDMTDKDWSEVMELNLMSHIRLSREAVPHMKSAKTGSIIFISSIFGRESGGATLSIYNTTKSAMISLAKVMAVELAPHGVRVNSVAPGSIRFPGGSWDKRCTQDPEGMKVFIEKELPLGRFGTVEEVADVVSFLCSEKASLVTGTCLNVDGCQSRSLI